MEELESGKRQESSISGYQAYALIDSHNELVGISLSQLACDQYGSTDVQNIPVAQEIYEERDHYKWENGQLVRLTDEEYAAKVAIREREELDMLYLTPADVERALYRARGMDFEDLKALIAEKLPNIDLKGLAIEFHAREFYRGATAGGIRLFDAVGQLLGYNSSDMDFLFKTGNLP